VHDRSATYLLNRLAHCAMRAADVRTTTSRSVLFPVPCIGRQYRCSTRRFNRRLGPGHLPTAHCAMRAADVRTTAQCSCIRPLHRTSRPLHDAGLQTPFATWTPARLCSVVSGEHENVVRKRRLVHLVYGDVRGYVVRFHPVSGWFLHTPWSVSRVSSRGPLERSWRSSMLTCRYGVR